MLEVAVGNQLGKLLEEIDGICDNIVLGPLVGVRTMLGICEVAVANSL